MSKFEKEKGVWERWKKNPSPKMNRELLDILKPRIDYAVKKFTRSGIPANALKTQAKKLSIAQAKTYDPGKGVLLSTHITHGLRKMTDYVEDEKNVVRIPNYVRNQVATFMEERDKLVDELGRDPNIEEIADKMKIGKNLASKLESSIDRKELTHSLTQLDIGDVYSRSEEEELIISHYYDIKDPGMKTIYEYTFGLFGKKRLKPKEISKRTKVNEQKVRRIQSGFAKDIKKYYTGQVKSHI